MNAVLYEVAKMDARMSPHPMNHSSSSIARALNIPLWKAKKELQKLKKAGYLIVTNIGGQDDDGQVWCSRGYELSLYGQETEEYVKAVYEEQKLCCEIFGGSYKSYAHATLHPWKPIDIPSEHDKKITEIEKRLGYIE